jgi:hypothetical protein
MPVISRSNQNYQNGGVSTQLTFEGCRVCGGRGPGGELELLMCMVTELAKFTVLFTPTV